MKRSPLTRKSPLRRTKFKRSKPRPNPAGSDKKHLAWVRAQPCCVCSTTRTIEAHHPRVGAGMSRKAPDRDAIPMCYQHHRLEFHMARGFFAGWTKVQRKAWQRAKSALYSSEGQTV